MKSQKSQSLRKRVMWSVFLLVPVIGLNAGSAVNGGDTHRTPHSAPHRAVSNVHLIQNPNQAESYRRLAAAKRKAADNVPAKRECYLAWARYYDCLAGKYQTGDNRDCGKEPPAC